MIAIVPRWTYVALIDLLLATDATQLKRILVALVFIAIVGFVAVCAYRNRDIPFTSERWKSNPSQRPRMVSDLLADGKLDGATRADVDRMLGVPSTGPDSIIGDKYVYWAGTDGVIDDMWLEVTFADDRVVDIGHVPD